MTSMLRPAGEHPSGDDRFGALDVMMKRALYRQDILIEVLRKAQQLFGCLELDVLHYVASSLKLPPSRVYGVATFYHLFTLKPHGVHTCVICMGTACYVKGSRRTLAAVQNLAGVKLGEMTADGQVSLLSARCVGACGIAPVVIYDGLTAGHQTVDRAVAQLKGWVGHGAQ
jgi:bidirectional [NiFe] hydrogenase diaphorase subunit